MIDCHYNLFLKEERKNYSKRSAVSSNIRRRATSRIVPSESSTILPPLVSIVFPSIVICRRRRVYVSYYNTSDLNLGLRWQIICHRNQRVRSSEAAVERP